MSIVVLLKLFKTISPLTPMSTPTPTPTSAPFGSFEALYACPIMQQAFARLPVYGRPYPVYPKHAKGPGEAHKKRHFLRRRLARLEKTLQRRDRDLYRQQELRVASIRGSEIKDWRDWRTGDRCLVADTPDKPWSYGQVSSLPTSMDKMMTVFVYPLRRPWAGPARQPIAVPAERAFILPRKLF